MSGLRQTAGVFLLALLAVARPSATYAHAVGAEARLKDGRVLVEGYFDDDTPAADARVWVEDGAKQRLAEGRTDARGRWSFLAPPAGRYRVVLDAGGGHQAAISVTIPAPASVTAMLAATDEAPQRVSEGKSREEFTQVPWLRLGLGLTGIGLAAVVLPRLLRTVRRRPVGDKRGPA